MRSAPRKFEILVLALALPALFAAGSARADGDCDKDCESAKAWTTGRGDRNFAGIDLSGAFAGTSETNTNHAGIGGEGRIVVKGSDDRLAVRFDLGLGQIGDTTVGKFSGSASMPLNSDGAAWGYVELPLVDANVYGVDLPAAVAGLFLGLRAVDRKGNNVTFALAPVQFHQPQGGQYDQYHLVHGDGFLSEVTGYGPAAKFTGQMNFGNTVVLEGSIKGGPFWGGSGHEDAAASATPRTLNQDGAGGYAVGDLLVKVPIAKTALLSAYVGAEGSAEVSSAKYKVTSASDLVGHDETIENVGYTGKAVGGIAF